MLCLFLIRYLGSNKTGKKGIIALVHICDKLQLTLLLYMGQTTELVTNPDKPKMSAKKTDLANREALFYFGFLGTGYCFHALLLKLHHLRVQHRNLNQATRLTFRESPE